MTAREIAAGMTVTRRVEVTMDVVLAFAATTGDDAAHHVDPDHAARTALGAPVAHGVLLIGFVSAASSELLEDVDEHYVSTGYDRVRFRRPLLVGDVAEVRYTMTDVSADGRSTTAEFQVSRGDGTVCCTGHHLMRRLDRPG